AYKKNQGRIKDVDNLNQAINQITRQHTTAELVDLFTAITVPISPIKGVEEVTADPLVQKRLLSSKDAATGIELTLAPPPNMTPYLADCGQTLSFPPRFGEHNQEIYQDRLGYAADTLAQFKEKGII
ncbi:MAG: CoA transferase, partial [Desulfobacteraceae bacterium]|nr:CoA transferase [Desulfobacteraceae bacterium]